MKVKLGRRRRLKAHPKDRRELYLGFYDMTLHKELYVYPYDLGMRISDGRLVRIPKGSVPVGCVKVNKIKKQDPLCQGWYYWVSVYDEGGRLSGKYWNLPLWNESLV